MLHISKPAERSCQNVPDFCQCPKYDLKIRPSSSLHQIMFNETMVAASDRTMIVHEQELRPVVYFPRMDVETDLFSMEEKQTYCPFKGTASYWTIRTNGYTARHAAWSYEAPFEEFQDLGGYFAFYLDKVDCYWRNGMEQPLPCPGRSHNLTCCESQAA
ncbi:hypothetical protein MNBD_ALPHA04-2189 [hydrothermal vent metagenome]|uniref:DUF427 domain-containing protein n=1 Tax=hydrothermal vent metagenome TaxID=652676 RepID=A0A3B0SEH4_9ZZZZ